MSLELNHNPPDRSGSSPHHVEAAEFGQLFRASFRALWLVAYGVLQDPGLAEDVVQEAALIALSKMHEFQPGSDFTAWMAKIVRYTALNQARARRRRRTAPIESAAVADLQTPARNDATDSADALRAVQLAHDQPWFDDRVIAALRQLDTAPRTCLLLRTIEGLDYAEIARLVNIPAGTAMSHVHRARQFLRTELADLEPRGGPTDAAPT